MRMEKVLGVALLLVFGSAVVLAVSDTASVNASFSIPSWISLSVQGSGDVSFADVTGPGNYGGSNGTELRVLSTTSWSIGSGIVWKSSTTPKGASESAIETALSLGFDKTSGAWGIHSVNVSYSFELDVDDMANMPEGDYNLVVQYTATTD